MEVLPNNKHVLPVIHLGIQEMTVTWVVDPVDFL